jgi:tRNA U55 pseudouridine synthase TruB
MATLRRTETGGFSLEEATALDDIGTDHLLPLSETVRVLPSVDLSDDHANDVSFGRKLPATLAGDLPDGAFIALRADKQLVAVYKRAGDELAADRVVPA